MRYAGTAGGLLHTSSEAASLLTPLAVVGDDVESVSRQLDALLSEPSEEMEARRTLGRLETRILHELGQGDEPTDSREREDLDADTNKTSRTDPRGPPFDAMVHAWLGVKLGHRSFWRSLERGWHGRLADRVRFGRRSVVGTLLGYEI